MDSVASEPSARSSTIGPPAGLQPYGGQARAARTATRFDRHAAAGRPATCASSSQLGLNSSPSTSTEVTSQVHLVERGRQHRAPRA